MIFSGQCMVNKTHRSVTGQWPALAKYQAVILGCDSTCHLQYLGLWPWLAKLPGTQGITLRKLLWSALFGCEGTGAMFAENGTIRRE